MAKPILVSYDGTPNDDDALALGRLLAAGGAPLALAYVRHSREFDPRREELAEHDARRRLAQGAAVAGRRLGAAARGDPPVDLGRPGRARRARSAPR